MLDRTKTPVALDLRVDKRRRQAEARLAAHSFDEFVRAHNRSLKPFEPNPRGL